MSEESQAKIISLRKQIDTMNEEMYAVEGDGITVDPRKHRELMTLVRQLIQLMEATSKKS
jgi:hypothetical protein